MRCSLIGGILLGSLLTLLGGSPIRADEPLQVSVSIAPQKYFVERIGGSRVTVAVMVEPGIDPHRYEPKPPQMKALTHSKIYFGIGAPFERAWLPRIAAANPKMLIAHMDKGIEKLPMPGLPQENPSERSPMGGGPLQGTPDPHIWLAPPLIPLQARQVVEALIRVDPAHRAHYEDNYRNFILEVVELDLELSRLFAGIKGSREILVYHPAWSYFTEAYGLKQIPIEMEGKEPRGPYLKHLTAYAREHGIKAIFVQPQLPTSSAQTIAQATGGQVISVDPLSEDWARNLREVGQKFRSALK